MEQISYNIIIQLQKDESHIRGISNNMKINHMTILRKIKDLEDNNIVDFKKEGRNKVYFIKDSIEAREFIKMGEHYKLIELIRKHPKFRKIIDHINFLNIDLAIIFGSYAKNSQTKSSDIDLYILTKNKKIKDNIESIDSRLNVKIGDFNKENLLIKEIMKNHIIIKGVDEYFKQIH